MARHIYTKYLYIYIYILYKYLYIYIYIYLYTLENLPAYCPETRNHLKLKIL